MATALLHGVLGSVRVWNWGSGDPTDLERVWLLTAAHFDSRRSVDAHRSFSLRSEAAHA
jgi:hypothetical protein